MIEKWAAVSLLVERMTRFGGGAAENDGLVIPVMVPLVVPTLFRYPAVREAPLELSWLETRKLTVEMGRAVRGAWPDGASRNYFLIGLMPHWDEPPDATKPQWWVQFDLDSRYVQPVGNA